MPDVTVELLTSSIAQLQNRGLELGNLPRNGQVVEARVIALLKDGMARLALLGQTIDVNAPSTLQPGTSISACHGEGRDHRRAFGQLEYRDPKCGKNRIAAAKSARSRYTRHRHYRDPCRPAGRSVASARS